MNDILMRQDTPFGDDIWKQIDELVEHVARQRLVGRRMIHLIGPTGMGAVAAPLDRLDDSGDTIQVRQRELLPYAVLEQGFRLSWQEITTAQQSGLPLELGPAAEAAMRLATKEDRMIFDALRQAEGATTLPYEGWDTSEGAFQKVSEGLSQLTGRGFYGPYALVVSPGMHAQLHRLMNRGGRLEITFIEDMLGSKVLFSPDLGATEGFLIANAAYNLDLVVAQDIVVGYAGNEGLDHLFHLIEKLVLRVKRPGAIITIQ